MEFVEPQGIYEDLLSNLKESKIREVRIGLHMVGVRCKKLGLSLLYQNFQHSGIAKAGNLTRLSGFELAKYILSWNFVESSVGLATINALIDFQKGENLNAFDWVKERARGKRIAVIGHFPRTKELKKGYKVWVFERNPQKGDLPDSAEEYYLPKVEVVMVTGSALINKTMPRILALSKNAYTIVLGPSTPVSPLWFKYGVDAVAGSRVRNEEEVLKKLTEGSTGCDLMKDLEFSMIFNPDSKDKL
jgi:hypothetical protein